MTIRRFYPGGALKLEMRCRNGVPHGPARQFYESGQLQIDMNYKNGIPSGPYTLYYETGNPQMTATLQDGKVSGQVQRFKADGTPIDPALFWGDNEEKLWVAGDVFVPWETCLTQAINSSLGLLMTETAWAEGFEYENDGQTYFIPLKQWRTPEQADAVKNGGISKQTALCSLRGHSAVCRQPIILTFWGLMFYCMEERVFWMASAMAAAMAFLVPSLCSLLSSSGFVRKPHSTSTAGKSMWVVTR